MRQRILIVDDMEYIRQTLRAIFISGGFEVCGEAKDGVEGINLYHTLRPDLLTLDIGMPRKSGLQVIKEIIDSDNNAKIIVISSLPKKMLVFDVAKAGAKAFIVKPFDAKKVLDVVRKVLKTENTVFIFKGRSNNLKKNVPDIFMTADTAEAEKDISKKNTCEFSEPPPSAPLTAIDCITKKDLSSEPKTDAIASLCIKKPVQTENIETVAEAKLTKETIAESDNPKDNPKEELLPPKTAEEINISEQAEQTEQISASMLSDSLNTAATSAAEETKIPVLSVS